VLLFHSYFFCNNRLAQVRNLVFGRWVKINKIRHFPFSATPLFSAKPYHIAGIFMVYAWIL
jgi:hypothetical protein